MLIPPVLLALLPKAKMIGIALGIASALGLGVYVWHLRSTNAKLTREIGSISAQRDQAIGVADANRAALARAMADAAAALSALEAEKSAMARKLIAATRLRSEIDHAPAQDDGPVASVLRRALNGLRHDTGNPPRAGGPDRAPAGAGRPVELRPGPVGP